MAAQKIDDKIQFDIVYDDNHHPHVKPKENREGVLGDTAVDTIVEAITSGYEKKMKEVLKHLPQSVKILHSIKLNSVFITKDYLLYLYEERKKYGDEGIKDHIIAAGQTMAGYALGLAGGAVGAAGGGIVGTAVPVVGNVAGVWTGGISGAISMSVAYDNKDINGQPLKDHVGDFFAFISGKVGERDNKAVNQLWNEKVSLPNLIKDNPNFVSNTEGLNEFNRILSVLDRNVAKKITNELLSKNTAAGSCAAEVETGGSCKAENLDDIQGKGTYFNPDEVQKLYQTLDKKGIILDRSIISDDIRQSSSAHEDLSSKTHVVEKGDTVWSIAKSYGISIN